MRTKIILIIAVFCLIGEILFSFYYSSTSLSLNEQYNSIQSTLSQLKITQEQLEIDLAEMTSLNSIDTLINDQQLVPIKKSL